MHSLARMVDSINTDRFDWVFTLIQYESQPAGSPHSPPFTNKEIGAPQLGELSKRVAFTHLFQTVIWLVVPTPDPDWW